jgi:hypothetical protein
VELHKKRQHDLNSIILAEKQELETKLVKESLAKDGEHFIGLFIFVFK